MTHNRKKTSWRTPQWSGPRLRDLSPDDRPRERLLNEGTGKLDHASLLSLMLGTGRSSDEDALMLARRILSTLGSLRALALADAETLCEIRGVGPAKATRLLAAFELARRALLSNEEEENDREQPYTLNLNATLVALARDRWDGEGTLIIACPKPQELSFEVCSQVIDSAITLALGVTLSDVASYGRWLARLLIEEVDAPWCLISLRPHDELTHQESESIMKFIEGSHLLQLDIESIVVASLDQHWVLFESNGSHHTTSEFSGGSR